MPASLPAPLRSPLRLPALLLVVAGFLGAGTALLPDACADDALHAIQGAPVPATAPALAPPRADDAVASAKTLGRAIADVAERARPAVVFIQVESTGPSRADAFGARSAPRQGQGSGFVISEDGLVLTNAHVVADAARIAVRFADGREREGSLLGADADSDVALLRVEGRGLPHLELADSNRIRVGEWVVAVGNPFGLTQTVTAGIVSAKGRNAVGINDLEDFIQTDAAINPGNSGGPLLDLDGRVVGINSAIYSRDGGSMGIGFAVPSNLVLGIAAQLREDGRVRRGFLGVGIQDLTPDLARAFGAEAAGGALITEVQPDGAAARAGLRVGDVVLSVDGVPLANGGALRNAVSLQRPGSEVHLSVLRDRIRRDVRVRLGGREREAVVRVANRERPGPTGLGLEVERLDDALRARLPFDVDHGLVVSRVARGSPAWRAGLRPGTVILDVEREPVDDPDRLVRRIENAGPDGVLLRIRDVQGLRWTVLHVPTP